MKAIEELLGGIEQQDMAELQATEKEIELALRMMRRDCLLGRLALVRDLREQLPALIEKEVKAQVAGAPAKP